MIKPERMNSPGAEYMDGNGMDAAMTIEMLRAENESLLYCCCEPEPINTI